jgi:hypothetical protein
MKTQVSLLDRLDNAIKELEAIRDGLDDDLPQPHKPNRWVDDLQVVMRNGGTFSLNAIYRAMKVRRTAFGRSWANNGWPESTVRNTLQHYCPQAKNFKGEALFEHVGRGRYRLT